MFTPISCSPKVNQLLLMKWKILVNISINKAIPMGKIDEFSVSDKANDAIPALRKKRRILALQSFEEEKKLTFISVF